MKAAYLLSVILLALLCMASPAWALEPAVTITADPSVAEIGDHILLSGTCTGVNTIAVYLFMTGPGIPEGGAAPAGNQEATRLSYQAVYMTGGGVTWEYDWDTGLVPGGLEAGEYTIWVTTAPPKDGVGGTGELSDTAEVTIIDPDREREMPGFAAYAALLALSLCAVAAGRRKGA